MVMVQGGDGCARVLARYRVVHFQTHNTELNSTSRSTKICEMKAHCKRRNKTRRVYVYEAPTSDSDVYRHSPAWRTMTSISQMVHSVHHKVFCTPHVHLSGGTAPSR